MDALLNSNRVPEPQEATIILATMNTERDSINTLDTRIHQLEQDAELARQRIQRLTAQLEAETRIVRLHKDAILELQSTRNALGQSIERKQAIMSSRRRIPGEVWRKIFLLLWGSEFQQRKEFKRPLSVALQVGAVCREWRDLAQTTTRLWSILDYTFSPKGIIQSRRDNKLDHYLGRIGTAAPYIVLRDACSLLLPDMLCQVTTATDLTVVWKHPDLQSEPLLTFPLSTPVFSHLFTLSIFCHKSIIRTGPGFLHPFPSLGFLRLRNVEIHSLQPIVPHINLKILSIGGTWERLHPWANVTIDIAIVAEWFPNLTVLNLDCNWQISTPQVVLHHVKRLCIRSSAITNVHGLTLGVSFPNLNEIDNIDESIKGLAPIVQAWGERVKTLVLGGIEPYDGSSQPLSEILGDSGKLPRISKLDFVHTRMIDLALVVDAVVRRNDLAANGQASLSRIETITLPVFRNTDPNLKRLQQHVTVHWK
jgi:hypothetical protein